MGDWFRADCAWGGTNRICCFILFVFVHIGFAVGVVDVQGGVFPEDAVSIYPLAVHAGALLPNGGVRGLLVGGEENGDFDGALPAGHRPQNQGKQRGAEAASRAPLASEAELSGNGRERPPNCLLPLLILPS